MTGWWQLASVRVSKLLERPRTLMHYIREAILWVQGRVAGKFVGCRQKLLHIGELSSVKLLSLIKTQFILDLMQGRRLLCCIHCDTCGLYPSQRLFNLEGTRIGSLLFLAAELSTDKYAVTIFRIVFGCYTAGSHLIIGLERTIIHWHWTLDAASHTR